MTMGIGKVFLKWTQKTLMIKEMLDALDHIKLRKICSWKELREWKDKPQSRKNICNA